jgi:hypothetical protein
MAVFQREIEIEKLTLRDLTEGLEERACHADVRDAQRSTGIDRARRSEVSPQPTRNLGLGRRVLHLTSI